MMIWAGKKRNGIALILTIGILGLITLIGISFALNMLLTRKEAANFLSTVKAKYIAEAGIKRAIMDIREQVASLSYADLKAYINNNYIASSGTDVPFGEGSYRLAVTSEEEKVNINTFDEVDTSQINILKAFLTDQQIANIIDYRDPDGTNTVINGTSGNIEGPQCKNRLFDSISEIRAATGITQAVFDANKDKITIYKPIIRGGLLGKYYSNITGASPNVAIDKSSFKKKVVELGAVYQTPDDQPLPGTDGDSGDVWAETHDAEFAGGSSIATMSDFGLTIFGVIWTGYLEILPGETNIPIDFWIASDDGARFYIIDGNNEQKVCDIWTDTGGASYPFGRTATGTYTFPRTGWYRIRLEYYDQTFYNSVQLKWKNAAFAPAPVIPAERLGYDPPTEVPGGYNHAGIYRITATASVAKSGLTTAVKQITAVAEVFDTWTQTTKEEFYAAWFNQKGNFRDGEVFNVNWLDSCPTDDDSWNGVSKMHWEENYTKTLNSVKLGYWDNFDEDPAYSAVMMKGYKWNRGWRGPWPTGSGTLYISYQDFKDSDGDGDNEVSLDVNTFEAKHFELNRNYFRPTTQSVFVRAYTGEPAPSSRIAWRGGGTLYPGPLPPPSASYAPAGWKSVYYYDMNGNGSKDAGEPQVFPVYDATNGNAPVYIYNPDPVDETTLNSVPAPGSYHYWQPETPFCGCWLFAKGNADDTTPGWVSGCAMFANGFKTLVTDAHGNFPVISEPRPLWPDGDTNEIRLGASAFSYVQCNYISKKVISMIGGDSVGGSAQYCGWVNGILKDNMATWADWTQAYGINARINYAQNPTPDPLPIFKFVSNNQYIGADWIDYDRGQHVIGPSTWPYAGAVTPMAAAQGTEADWDDIRCMAASGFLVSPPFYAGSSAIRWGTISWGGQTPPTSTAITMYVRLAATYGNIPTADSGWMGAPYNGAYLGATSPWIQYKVVLSTSNINKDQYSASSRTPVFEDMTITYTPTVQIKYWKEGI